jgi:glutathione S-transferase
VPFAFGREASLSDEKKAKVEEALQWLDGFIEKSGGWVAGMGMTIADFAVVASVSSMDVRTKNNDFSFNKSDSYLGKQIRLFNKTGRIEPPLN